MSAPAPAAGSGLPGLVRLRLYVVPGAANSIEAEASLRRLLATAPFEVEVISVFELPEQAWADGVVVTPTLVIGEPGPPRRIIGNLSDAREVRRALGLDPVP